MKMEFFAQITGNRQDGAFFNGFLFSFNCVGECTVYEVEKLKEKKKSEAELFSQFTLDKKDIICPHSNSVMFGSEYYCSDDEFPLLYSNIYNNYSQSDNKLKGVCNVYRIQRNEKNFKTTLVQIIEVNFVENTTYWKSSETSEDVRPYGNFTIDVEKNIFYAFTMRDKCNTTRYFSFDLPKSSMGEKDKYFGVKKVVLDISDIKECFDAPYSRYIQGACCHKGKIYSLEGFTDDENNPPAIQIIDPNTKKSLGFEKFKDYGNNTEPEMIDFYDNDCYYTDHNGKMYKLFF